MAGGYSVWLFWTVDSRVPDECLYFFRNSCWYVNGGITLGLAGEYATLEFKLIRELVPVAVIAM